MNNEEFKTIIAVGINGHVWVAKQASFDGRWLNLLTARVIRIWGTTDGLNQLVNGPCRETVLDAIAPVVSVFHSALIAVIPCSDSAWQDHFEQ
jgi:hypothetical protein